MKYVKLGQSGLKVSQLILGCMSYGVRVPGHKILDWVLSEEESFEHFQAAYDAGINTFDTADIYGFGTSEEFLGKWMKTKNIPRENVVIMTKTSAKYGNPQSYGPAGYNNNSGLSRKRIFAAVKGSLERLQTDYIDVFQCHRLDPDTPFEETMQALHDVVKAGYVRYIGMSSCYAYQFQLMQQYAIQNKLTPFISMQNYYNPVYREEEREMIPTLKHFGVGSIPWSPLAGGFLAHPVREETPRAKANGTFYTIRECDKKVIKKIEELAAARGISMAQFSIAWTLSKDFITAPIIGTTKIDQMLDLVKATEIVLTEEEIKAVADLYETGPIQGHA